jgi:hypothetical protein
MCEERERMREVEEEEGSNVDECASYTRLAKMTAYACVLFNAERFSSILGI